MIYCAHSAYMLTNCFNYLHIMQYMRIVFILVIFYIFCMFCVSVFRCLFPLLFGPPTHPRAQLFTYYHLHPSSLFWLLSQEGPGKSADSLCMYKGIVPFSPNRDCFRCGKRKCFTQNSENPSALCLKKSSL